MVTSTLKNYTDENIIELIESIKSESISYNLNDLKAVLAEINTRHMDAQYADLLGELIRDKILNGDTGESAVKQEQQAEKNEKPAEETAENTKNKKEKTEKPPKKEKQRLKSVQQTAKEVAETEEENDSAERFPVLSFMTGFLKVFGWICLAVSVLYGLFESITKNLSNVRLAIGSIFFGLLIGTVLLLVLYAWSESICVKLEIERHLRKLSQDK